MNRLSETWDALEPAALKLGAIRVGACALDDEHVGRFEHWLASGFAGAMQYLHRHLEVRRNPRARFPWANSAVVIIVPYWADRPSSPPDSIASRIARYAQGDDYHDVMDGMLRNLEGVLAGLDPSIRTWRYVDTGPLSDRSMAARSGLGWIGRNGMLIDPDHGSYFFIGMLLTSLECDLTAGEVADRCGECTRCVDLCPTSAIIPDRFVDSNRCISHATIEHRGVLDDAMTNGLSCNLFGCDICQEVCPWNESPPEGNAAFRTRENYRATPITDLLRMSQADFSSMFRRSAIKRAKRAGMIRNAILIAEQVSVEDGAALAHEDDAGIRAALSRRSAR